MLLISEGNTSSARAETHTGGCAEHVFVTLKEITTRAGNKVFMIMGFVVKSSISKKGFPDLRTVTCHTMIIVCFFFLQGLKEI